MDTILRKPATFQELINCSSIKSNVKVPFYNTYLPKMDKLYKLLAKYSNTVNPFGNNDLKIKGPGKHFKNVEAYLEVRKAFEPYTSLLFCTNSAHTTFTKNEEGFGFYYGTNILVQKNRMNSFLLMGYFSLNRKGDKPTDEIVHLNYTTNSNSFKHHPNKIDLRISLKTGLAWQTFEEEKAKPATGDQIVTVCTFLNISIKKINNDIVSNIINL